MPQGDSRFSMLDEAAIARAELRRDPYDFAFVEQAISPQFKDEVLADAPQIPAVNFRITDEVDLGKGSEGVKFADNLNAIRILKAIEGKKPKGNTERAARPCPLCGLGWSRQCVRRPGR